MQKETLLRCSDCAFVNPEGSEFCGMCGSGLARVRIRKKKDDDSTYVKAVVEGDPGKAFNYAYGRWLKELWMLILGAILASIVVAVMVMSTAAWVSLFGGLGFWIAVDLVVLAFMWVASCRVFLDVARGRGVDIGRALYAGTTNFLPAVWVIIWLVAGAAATVGVFLLWVIPMNYIQSPQSPLPEGVGEFLMVIWLISLLVLVGVPMAIWLMMGTTMAMFRILDRKSSVWSVPVWAIREISEHHWELFKIGWTTIFTQMIGLAICYVGGFATVPLAGIELAAAYEWLRLHGTKPDDY